MDFVWAILAGSLVPLQAGLNSQLKNVLGHPVLSVFVSVLVSIIGVGIYIVGARIPLSGFASWQQAPWFVWLGGVFGALLLLATTSLAQRMGSMSLVACIIAGQIICSIICDQFGLIGFRQHSINGGRIVGTLLLCGGVYLILKN